MTEQEKAIKAFWDRWNAEQDKINETKQTKVWLQGEGWTDCKPAGELKPGDIIKYNYGSTAKVTAVTTTKTGKSVKVTTEWPSGLYTHCYRISCKVAIAK